MKTKELFERYNFSEDTVRNMTENKNRIATMYGRELNRQKTAEENGKTKEAKQAVRNQQRILRNGVKIVEGTKKYKVPVVGKFSYEATVVASSEEDAERKAAYQAQHMCLPMNPKVTKTGKPVLIR